MKPETRIRIVVDLYVPNLSASEATDFVHNTSAAMAAMEDAKRIATDLEEHFDVGQDSPPVAMVSVEVFDRYLP